MKSSRRCAAATENRIRAAGFSLVELLVTLAILLILATMMCGFGSRSNQMAQKKKCQANLLKMYVALQIYSNDSAGKFPLATNARTSEEALEVLVRVIRRTRPSSSVRAARTGRCPQANPCARAGSATPTTWDAPWRMAAACWRATAR